MAGEGAARISIPRLAAVVGTAALTRPWIAGAGTRHAEAG
jgi:hypothetical protein